MGTPAGLLFQEAVFLRRYKRFFADIQLQGETVVAHVPNTGSLKGCLEEGCSALVSRSENPNRKLAYTLEFLKPKGCSWVGVNTGRANDLVWEVWLSKACSDWSHYSSAQREFKINAETRLDLKLFNENGESCFIEVKSVTMKHEHRALFPDAVTTRGQKHLRELMKLRESGHACELVFVVQREDASSFSPADEIDPEYGRLLREAVQAGVVVRAWPCSIQPDQVSLNPLKDLALVL